MEIKNRADEETPPGVNTAEYATQIMLAETARWKVEEQDGPGSNVWTVRNAKGDLMRIFHTKAECVATVTRYAMEATLKAIGVLPRP